MTITYDGIPFGLDTFRPGPGETIVVNIDTDVCPLDTAYECVFILKELYPENKIIGLLKGVTLETKAD